MVLKKRSSISSQADALADELADKAYGASPTTGATTTSIAEEKYVITSISLPQSLLHQLEDVALRNKRANLDPKTVSALLRQAARELLINS